MAEKFVITHYYKPPAMVNDCVPLHFITKKLAGEDCYFFEFETKIHLEPSAIKNSIDKGSLVALPYPREISCDHKLWLGSDKKIFLSTWDKEPDKDPNRINLAN